MRPEVRDAERPFCELGSPGIISCKPRLEHIVESTLESAASAARACRTVGNIDASRDLSDAQLTRLTHALHEHGVVVLPEQRLTDPQLARFCARFGTLKVSNLGRYLVEGMPELNIVSNVMEGDTHIGNPDAGLFWHTDSAYTAQPDLYSFLYALEVPQRDGRSLGPTLFADTAAAYDALDDAMKARLAGLKACNDLSHQYEKKRAVGFLKRGEITDYQKKVGTSAVHPLVRTHSDTGRKALYISEGHTASIVGLPREESDALLNRLFEHMTQERFVYKHEWQVGDLLIWDNSRTIHKAVFDYQLPLRRVMHRATTVGPVPH